MRLLVIDTETTGLFDFSKSADAEGQPRLANLAMTALDIQGEVVKVEAGWNLYVRPDGWRMNPEATKINGLTDAFLAEYGIPVREVLETYVGLIQQGYVVAAFNAQYDTKVMRGELRRAGMPDLFESTPNVCIMRALIGVCKLPKAKGHGYKFPKLTEACQHFYIPTPGSHTAEGDVCCTVDLIRRLVALKLMPVPEVHYAKERPV